MLDKDSLVEPAADHRRLKEKYKNKEGELPSDLPPDSKVKSKVSTVESPIKKQLSVLSPHGVHLIWDLYGVQHSSILSSSIIIRLKK